MTSFESLTSFDLELLTQDLLGAHFGVQFESFPPGRDGGVDLRLLGSGSTNAPDIVIQCKHYEKSGFPKLKSKMIEELETAIATKASRYILATTVPMTALKKSELRKALGNLITRDDDIFAKDDLEALIRSNPEIEKAHFKLWLNSTAVLERVLQNEIISRTEGHQEKLKENAKRFVVNQSVGIAQTRLHNDHVCIISGPPGVGKTTLAEIMLMTHVAEGFEPVFVSRDIGDADALFKKGHKQFFYYDDFLGRTTLVEKLEKNEDSRLRALIERVMKSPDKRFVLTTREHIFNDAKAIYDQIDSPEIDMANFVLDVSAYTDADRGKILYNHLYFSRLEPEQLESIVSSKVYVRLIESENFNPRLVEDAIKLSLKIGIYAEHLPKYLEEIFDSPVVLWENMMKNQFTHKQKVFLALILLENGSLKQDNLELFSRRVDSARNDMSTNFERELKGLEGTALKLTGSGENMNVQFSNPGVEDAVIEHILPQANILSSLTLGHPTYAQTLRAWNYANDTQAKRPKWLRYTGNSSMLPRADKLDNNPRKRQKSLELTIGEFLSASKKSAFDSSLYGSFEKRVLNCLRMAQHDALQTLTPDYFGFLCTETQLSWSKGKGSHADAWNLLESVIEDPSLVPEHLIQGLVEAGLRYIFEKTASTSEDFGAKYYASKAIADEDMKISSPVLETPPSPEDIIDSIRDHAELIANNIDDIDSLYETRETLEHWQGLLEDLELDSEEILSDAWIQLELLEADQFEPDSEPNKEDGSSHAESEGPTDLDYMFSSLNDR